MFQIGKFVELIKWFIPLTTRANIRYSLLRYLDVNQTFSWCGEDCILNYLFQKNTSGFYVDIGAYHPFVSSNTYRFYLKGWRGINIDARPGSMEDFRRFRPRDINLEIAIADSDEFLTYYQLDHDLMNSFSKKFLNYLEMENYVKDQLEIKTLKLSKVLDEYLPKEVRIDFMSVDVEGLEYEVLKSNDWSRYSPKVVLIESFERNLSNLLCSKIVDLMNSNNYDCFAKTPNGIFFLQKSVQLHQVNFIIE